jgi:two-component system, cell cycle response regulator DivK
MDTLQKKVLIVEDEASIINGISDKFTHEGFLVFKAKDGQEGLDRALREHPDFILLDNLMPDTDGFYLLENLRKDKWGKNVPVVMWSNSHGSKTIARAKKMGVLDFMIKSEWEYRDIVKKVREILSDTIQKNIHILIIDNDEVMRRLYGSLLGRAGYEVLYAPDADQGRELARRFQPNLILMDIEMPGMDGITASRILKKEPTTAHIPIVLLTNADLSIEAEKWMKEISIIEYIQKGISNEEFIERIKKVFEKMEGNPSQKIK